MPFARLKIPLSTPPMEARLIDHLPDDEGWQFEPKWDGFRCLAFRDGDEVALMSKSGKPLERYFPELVDLVRVKGSPVASEGVRQIAALYRIERRIYGLPPAERLAVRQSEAVPLLDALRAWLTERLSQVAPRSELAKALG